VFNIGCTNQSKPTNNQEIKFSYECFIDYHNTYSIHKLEKIPFKYLCDINFPFFDGSIWIKIKLSNLSYQKKELVIFNNDIINRSYKFYQLDTNNNKVSFTETNTTNDNRSFNFSKPNFKVTLAPNEESVFFIHAQSDGRAIRATPLIKSLPEFIKTVRNETIKNIFFFGVIFIILLINIFYWTLFKKKVYLFYTCYIFFTSIFYLGFDGYLFNIGLPLFIVEQLIFVLLKCMILFLLLFSANFLNINHSHPKFYKLLKNNSALLMLVILSYQILFCAKEIGKIHFIEFVFGLLWLYLLIVMIIIASKKQKMQTRYYLIAMLFALFFVFIGILNIYFATDTTGKFYFKIGTTIEFIIFTYTTAKILSKNNSKASLYAHQKELLQKSNSELQSKLNKANNNRIQKSDFLSIFKLLESNITQEEEWLSFKNKFQEFNPDFFTNLYKKHPNLTKTEIRLLTLIKIGFTQKEISNILFIAESSVKKAKQRVRKKIILCSKITLTNYLATF